MTLKPGDRVLEVGIGTGLTASLYPRDCNVTGIDVSTEMLEKARERLRRDGLRNVRLVQTDAAKLCFDDESFDVVYAPYTISAVQDPLGVAREMRRVCKAGGRLRFVNHFLSANPVPSMLERAISPLTAQVGFTADLDLEKLLERAGLRAVSVEKVNTPAFWTLVTCIRS